MLFLFLLCLKYSGNSWVVGIPSVGPITNFCNKSFELVIEEVVFNVSFDCYITSFVVKAVFEKDNGEYESWFVECEYKYDNVDFTALDAKIAELTSAE